METVINVLKQDIPLKGFLYTSNEKIKHFVLQLKPYIRNPEVLNFILSISQQDLQMELLFVWWHENKSFLHEIINDLPLECLRAFTLILSRHHYSVDNLLAIPNKEELNESLEYIITHPNIDNFIKSDAVVLFANYNSRNTIRSPELQEAINAVRAHVWPGMARNVEVVDGAINCPEHIIRNRNGKIRTVYNDSQNVHNSAINNSVINAAQFLITQTGALLIFEDGYKIRTFLHDNLTTVIERFKKSNNIVGNVTIMINNKPATSLDEVIELNALQIVPSLKINNHNNTCNSYKKYNFFKNEEILYSTILGMNDIIFPEDVKHEGEIGQRLNQVFIATNKLLYTVKETDINLYLEFTGIENASEIWENRFIIVNELKKIYNNQFISNRVSSLLFLNNKTEISESVEFVDKVFNELFPAKILPTNFKRNIQTANVRGIYVLDLLNAVWKFIHSSKYKTELINRLKEELQDSFEVCTTGLFARLINVIQGFTENPLLTIKISIEDDLKVKITEQINKKCLKKQIDPVVDDVVFKEMVYKWMCKNVQKFLQEFSSLNSDQFFTFCTKMYSL